MAAVAGIAVLLFTRFGINGLLSRDEGIYAYAAQQFAHGVPPYKSIFDPKAPVASLLGGVAAALARLVGRNELYAIRVVFFLCSVLTVMAIYMLVVRLWRSRVAGVFAGVVFASFLGFAEDALSGPDAKTPGILCVVLSMWLMARRNWAWAALFGSVAFLTWQPLLIYPALPVVLAVLLTERGRRGIAFVRTAVAAVAPVAATVIYFAATGALHQLFESTLAYPLTGVHQKPVSFGHRFSRIAGVVTDAYKFSGVLLWLGLIALVVLCVLHIRRRTSRADLLRDPLLAVVGVTFLFEALYAIYDFQGYPDVYPLLPYGAIGLGGAAAVLIARTQDRPDHARSAVAATVALSVVLTGVSLGLFIHQRNLDPGLRAQQADACAVTRLLKPGGRLYVMGNPAVLAVTHRRNPDRYAYLEAGVDQWKINHTEQGFAGWVGQVERADPAIIAIGGWYTGIKDAMGITLQAYGYIGRYAGQWWLLMKPEVLARAHDAGVRLPTKPTDYATGLRGRELPASGC